MNARSPMMVQAALKQIRGSNGRPLWPGPIDGKNGTRDIDSLSAAIAGFESKANLRITGTMPNSGNAFNALGRALPTSYKDMHGIPGTNIVAGHVAAKDPTPTARLGYSPTVAPPGYMPRRPGGLVRRGAGPIEHRVRPTTKNLARNSGTYSATGANFRLT